MTASERIRRARLDREFWLIILTSWTFGELDCLASRYWL
jgi:hypothetical protein